MQIQENVSHDEVISISGLYKSFGEKEVLTGIDLVVKKGETLIVLGRSGVGKSVLIKIVCGMIEQDKGLVTVLNKEVTKLNKKELKALRLKIGFSFQSSALYDSMTVRENLQFPLIRIDKTLTIKEINKTVDSILDDIGLPSLSEHMPSELSGGEKKRIGIGRTLIIKPEIMLYDEPTAGLDPISSMEINNLINTIKNNYNVSSILITHDLTCAKATGNRLAMLLEGKVIKQGSFKELFETDDLRIKGFYNYNFTN